MSTNIDPIRVRDLKRGLRLILNVNDPPPYFTIYLTAKELAYLIDAATAYQPDHRDAPKKAKS